MTAERVVIAHLSDLHFGGYADLAQIEALETFLPTLRLDAVVVSGDLTQRARHGEFQAAHAFVHRLRPHAPVLVVPGNHDIEWWRSPLGLLGEGRKYRKYFRYFGDLTPGAGDSRRRHRRRAQQLRRRVRLAHLEHPRRRGEGPSAPERDRPGGRGVRRRRRPARRGCSSSITTCCPARSRAGWDSPAGGRRTAGCSPPAPTSCSAATITRKAPARSSGALAVSTSGTHSSRSRGGRPSVFNLVRIDGARCTSSTTAGSADAGVPALRHLLLRAAGPPKVAVSVAGGDQGL